MGLPHQTTGVISLENRCVCCGEIIPEGWQVCMECERRAFADDNGFDSVSINLRDCVGGRSVSDYPRQDAVEQKEG